MEAHRIAECFPILRRSDLQKLADSIKEHGLRNAIVLWEGKILDGRNRYLACKIAGVEPRYVQYDGPDDDWVAAGHWVIDQNLSRRHLDAAARACAATKLHRAVVGRPKKKITPDGVITKAEAAKLFDTTPTNIDRADVVQRHGVPELVEAVESSQVSLAGAAEVARLPPERQREAVAGGRAAVSRAAENARATRAAKVKPPREVSSEPRTKRAARAAADVLSDMADAIQMVKRVAYQLSGGGLVIGESERDILLLGVGELHTLTDWIDTLARGGHLDDELVKLLKGA